MRADPQNDHEQRDHPPRAEPNPSSVSDERKSRARWPLTVAAVLITLLLLFAVAWSALRWQKQMRAAPPPATGTASVDLTMAGGI